jgi:hypothetical protein
LDRQFDIAPGMDQKSIVLYLHLKVQMQRVESSSSLLRMLEVQEQRAWQDIGTLDESRFYHSVEHESI